MLILMAGLPGTGKTTLARELARRTGGHVLNKDEIRDTLFGPDYVEYTNEQDDFVMRTMLEVAAWMLRKQSDLRIFLDGRVFSRSSQIEEVIAFAENIGTPWHILECVCSEGTARERLERDAARAPHIALNRDFQLYQEVKSRFEPIARSKVTINTGEASEKCVASALQAIF